MTPPPCLRKPRSVRWTARIQGCRAAAASTSWGVMSVEPSSTMTQACGRRGWERTESMVWWKCAPSFRTGVMTMYEGIEQTEWWSVGVMGRWQAHCRRRRYRAADRTRGGGFGGALAAGAGLFREGCPRNAFMDRSEGP